MYHSLRTSVPDLRSVPRGVTHLSCANCAIKSLANAPPALERLELSACSDLTSLAGLPQTVRDIDCGGCASLTDVSGLPELTKLQVVSCALVTNLDHLPSTLIELKCCSTGVTALDKLPLALRRLDAQNNPLLASLDLSHTSVTHLDCKWCNSLVRLDKLPDTLVDLDASRCSKLAYVGGRRFRKLTLDGCYALRYLAPQHLRHDFLAFDSYQPSIFRAKLAALSIR